MEEFKNFKRKKEAEKDCRNRQAEQSFDEVSLFNLQSPICVHDAQREVKTIMHDF